jgi:hypothetical protein
VLKKICFWDGWRRENSQISVSPTTLFISQMGGCLSANIGQVIIKILHHACIDTLFIQMAFQSLPPDFG